VSGLAVGTPRKLAPDRAARNASTAKRPEQLASSQEEPTMYIGLGTVVVILLVILVIGMMRRTRV
jgi:hypothetical protein